MVMVDGKYVNQREYYKSLRDALEELSQQFRGAEIIIAALVKHAGGEVILKQELVDSAADLLIDVQDVRYPLGMKITVKDA
jgi:hypothetical protein